MDASVGVILLRLVVSMAVVIGLMVVAARFLQRRGLGGAVPRRHKREPALEVVARCNLSRAASVAVVRVGDRTLVLGFTDSGVSVLDEADPEHFLPEVLDVTEDDTTSPSGPAGPSPTWTSLLDPLRERTIRR